MRKIIMAIFMAGFAVYLILAFTGQMEPAAAAIQVVLIAVWCIIILSTWMLVRWLWRLIRGVRPHDVAHGAGALTGAVQRRSSSILQAFKAGYRGDDSAR